MKSPCSSPGHYNCWLNPAFTAKFRPTGLTFVSSEIKLKGFWMEWPLIIQCLRAKAMGSLEIKYVSIKNNKRNIIKYKNINTWCWGDEAILGIFLTMWTGLFFPLRQTSGQKKTLWHLLMFSGQVRWEMVWGHVPTAQIAFLLQKSREEYKHELHKHLQPQPMQNCQKCHEDLTQ